MITVFIREATEYDKLFAALGLAKVFEDYPPFTKAFLAQYETNVPDISKYMILWYRK